MKTKYRWNPILNQVEYLCVRFGWVKSTFKTLDELRGQNEDYNWAEIVEFDESQ